MTRLADADDPLVRETAMRLTGGEASVRGKVLRLFLYVRDEIKFGFTEEGDLVTASSVIRRGIGHCNTKATLLLALCKAAGIPARIHFALIRKEIQHGFFTGIAYWLLPPQISHSWIEVEVDGTWRRIDTFINDRPLFEAAKAELALRGWTTGFSVALENGKASCDLDLDNPAFQQMAAVTTDHGMWDDPADYYASTLYCNRPGALRMWLYRRLVRGVEARVEKLRSSSNR